MPLSLFSHIVAFVFTISCRSHAISMALCLGPTLHLVISTLQTDIVNAIQKHNSANI